MYCNLGTLVFVSEDSSFWETSDGHVYFILPNRGLYAVAGDECTKALDGAYPAVFEDSEEWQDIKAGLYLVLNPENTSWLELSPCNL